jgi:hypothetical protein
VAGYGGKGKTSAGVPGGTLGDHIHLKAYEGYGYLDITVTAKSLQVGMRVVEDGKGRVFESVGVPFG